MSNHTIVIGAGVIGLQTALTLLHHSIPVTIIAEHFPGDYSLHYTSPWAGAHWRADCTLDHLTNEITASTFQHWQKLLETYPPELTGLQSVPAEWYWEDPATVPSEQELWWKDVTPGFRVLRKEELPEGSVFGVHYETVAANPTVYMKFLLSEARKLGVRTVRKRLVAVEEVWGISGLEGVEAVVNCTGIGARNLVADLNVFPVKGQTILVEGECKTIRFRQTKEGFHDAVILRPGEGTILGVSKYSNDWSEKADEELSAWMLERARKWAPELLVGGKFKVIKTNVGRRPARKGGVRIEIQKVEMKGKKRIVCHHYGHGGYGFQQSVGSANAAVETLLAATGGKSKL